MLRALGFAMLLALAAPALSLAQEAPRDTDGDGIPDREEEILGTDPRWAEPLSPILDDGPEPEARRQQPGYDATKDVVKVDFGNVAEDRCLWRVTLADAPRLADTVLHLYVDADADAATGRKSSPESTVTGTDFMLSVVGDRGTSNSYRPDGAVVPGPAVSHVVLGNAVLMTADVNLGRDASGLRCALYVLCHTMTKENQPARMSDSTPKRLITGIPQSERKKILRLSDHQENFAVDATFGEDLLNRVLTAEENVVVPHDKLDREGFAVDLQTSRKWPHLSLEGAAGKAWTLAPKAGRYHVGFMMYDDSSKERIGISIDGQLCGVAAACEDNNRTWLYWLKDAREFKGGERVELQTGGGSGRHGICNLLFLAHAPEIRTVRFAVEDMASAASVDRPGRVTVSWTTTWPCPTRFEYGKDAGYGTTLEGDDVSLVHRVVLEGLDPNIEYHGRAVGANRDGSAFPGPDFTFRAAPPSPVTRDGVASVPLTVRNPYGFAVDQWPISTGIPFPKGQLANADHVRLAGPGGETPVQVRLTARWPDGSVKWLLATFQASVPASAQQEYRLEYGREIRRAELPPGLLVRSDDAGVSIDTGPLRLTINDRGELADVVAKVRPSDSRMSSHSWATGADGKSYTTSAAKAEVTVEEAGPIRAAVKTVSHLCDSQGVAILRVEKRIEAYRGSPMVRVDHTLVVDRSELFTELRELGFRIAVPAAGKTWRVPLADGKTLELNASQPVVRQPFDDGVVAEGDGQEFSTSGRVVGAILGEGPDGCAVAMRGFWQNYPKAFAVRPEGIDVGLCPAFAAGLYDKFPFEREGHHLYYYLLGGKYRLKRGAAKTHSMLLCFGPAEVREHWCQVFQRPILAAAPPSWYCDSKAFYDVAPRDPARFPAYEQAIDDNLNAYAAHRERQRDYGMLNFGDWYGERGANWGNIEYDTQHAMFLEYIRSGNAEAFFLGEAAELHNRDVDTVHASDDARQIGAVYVHQMGHVGGYYTESVPGTLGIPSAGFTVSHAWVEGHFDHYFLSGDRRSYETACAVADYFTRHALSRPYDFHDCRTPGWHLIMLASTYAATGDPYYLNAARIIARRVIESQDRQPRPLPDYQAAGRTPYQQGGWSRMMVPGHCTCEPRHRGNAGFMVAVLLSGLKYYHDVTGDPQVKESIIAGARYLLDETYSEEVQGSRYTSCPNTKYAPGASPLMAEGIARAYLWTRDERFRRVLTEALPRGSRGSPYGKGFSMYYRMAPRVLFDLDAAGLGLEKPAEQ